ncbi:MAG: efflux RND transporter permease subunit, partial [Candidatus Gracilibacteria bacterium]|nr:efflux RND transporter permease subunit [Candidatus Gracilibacteria bacterium]
ISIESDILSDYLPTDIQPELLEFAQNYSYPQGINFSAGGENEENKDLIVSTFKSLFIALFLIFSILVFQFNSFKQPAIVLYSVILALLGVNIGLYVTGNPYSMPFMIGFIALTGVVVNDAIILIDRINKNLEKGIDELHSVIGAGKSRLQPIIVTTLTTVFGVLPLAMQDEFWAGLGYTIVFGLFAGSAMTLFVIPSLYYEMILRKKDIKPVKNIKKVNNEKSGQKE